jgi:hypothetical protein
VVLEKNKKLSDFFCVSIAINGTKLVRECGTGSREHGAGIMRAGSTES